MGRKVLVAAVLVLICCAWVYAEDATNTTTTTPPASGVQTVRERVQFEKELRQKCRESGDWSEYWAYFQAKHPGALLHDTKVAVSPQAAQSKPEQAATDTTTDTGGKADKIPSGIGEGRDGKQAEGETSLHDRLQAANKSFRDAIRVLNDTWRQETKTLTEKLKALEKGDIEGRKALIDGFMASLQERKEDVQELISGHQETVQAIFAEYKVGMADKVTEGVEQSKEAKQKALESFNQRQGLTNDGKVKTTGKMSGAENSEKVKEK